MRLYAVTDRAWLGHRTLSACVEEAIAGGASAIQLREKDLCSAEFDMLARAVKPICQTAKVPLFINDDVELALRIGAEGVHVGQNDMTCREVRSLVGTDVIIGVSAQTVDEALAAQAEGADYLGVGAIFGTPTKSDAREVPLEILKAICAEVDIPVVAIGGLNATTMTQLSGTGADGVALVSAIFSADDILSETKILSDLIESTLGIPR